MNCADLHLPQPLLSPYPAKRGTNTRVEESRFRKQICNLKIVLHTENKQFLPRLQLYLATQSSNIVFSCIIKQSHKRQVPVTQSLPGKGEEMGSVGVTGEEGVEPTATTNPFQKTQKKTKKPPNKINSPKLLQQLFQHLVWFQCFPQRKERYRAEEEVYSPLSNLLKTRVLLFWIAHTHNTS